MASKHMTDIDEVVREKILKEIDIDKFTERAKNLIPTFSFPLNVQSLTMKEIIYIWITYENGCYKQEEKIDNFLVRNCNNCGQTHKINKCLAYGKQCNQCGDANHFGIRCPSRQYIADCVNCGESHFMQQCPAYFNQCNKCHRLRHFSWKCRNRIILHCKHCGLTHVASKTACPRYYI